MKKINRKRENLQGTLFASPPLIAFAIFGLIPLLVSLVLSFCLVEYNYEGGVDLTFVSFKNYAQIIQNDTRFIKSIGNTFLYTTITVFLQLAISLVLSICLNTKIKFKKIYRTILFIPYVCSAVAISIMWKWVFDYNYGILNDILKFFNAEPINWLRNPKTAMIVMIVISVWGGLGFNMILYSAALGSINKTYYEAAEIDGANKLQQFFNITLPQLKPITFYLVIMGFIGSLQSFANFQIMTPDGGPNNATLTMGFRVFQVAMGDEANVPGWGMGYASAMGWIVGMIVMIFVAVYFYFNNRKEKN